MCVPLSPAAVAALEKLTATARISSAAASEAADRPRELVAVSRSVFELAKVKDVHSHRFRDTFAVSLLENGVSIENVSVLLARSSVRIIERHYKPWVKTLQKKLEDRVRKAWA